MLGKKGEFTASLPQASFINLRIKNIQPKGPSDLELGMGQNEELAAEKPQSSQPPEVVNTFCGENRKQKSLKD